MEIKGGGKKRCIETKEQTHRVSEAALERPQWPGRARSRPCSARGPAPFVDADVDGFWCSCSRIRL